MIFISYAALALSQRIILYIHMFQVTPTTSTNLRNSTINSMQQKFQVSVISLCSDSGTKSCKFAASADRII